MKPGDEISHLEERLEVLLAQQGDADAFRRLVGRYERRLLYFILRFTDDAGHALDVLQEVWLSVFRLLPGLAAPEAFRVWLYKIAHGKVVEFLRREHRMPLSVDAGGSPRRSDGLRRARAGKRRARASGLRAYLSIEHREVLVLHFLEGMSLEEIAQAHFVPVGDGEVADISMRSDRFGDCRKAH